MPNISELLQESAKDITLTVGELAEILDYLNIKLVSPDTIFRFEAVIMLEILKRKTNEESENEEN